MKTIAEIAPIARLPRKLSFFDYEVPAEMESTLFVGQAVEIPLRKRKVAGIVLKLKRRTRSEFKGIKPVSKVIEGLRLPEPQVRLAKWISQYYLASLASVFKAIMPAVPKRKSSKPAKRIAATENASCPALKVPRTSLSKIKAAVEAAGKPGKHLLLYGDFRKKTAVFLKATERCLAKGRQVLVICPHARDIAPIYSCLAGKYKDSISLLFSDLPKNAYLKEWKRIASGQARVVIGTRSAVLAPAKDLGLVILDDEESWDHKQPDRNPRYDARRVAEKLADLHGSAAIFASQAPSAEAWKKAADGKWKVLRLDRYPSQSRTVVDMNDELVGQNFSPLSNRLQGAIEKTLAEGKRAVLLLNRKGSATLVACRDCGHVCKCPDCRLAFDCESQEGGTRLVCRHCKRKQPVPLACPGCQGTNIRISGTGIQKVEKELAKLFPRAKVVSIDKKTEKVAKFDIAVGTRAMLEKKIPGKIGLVAIVSADTLLHRPDFRSGEKAFKDICKTINWSRTRFLPSLPKLIIQTYNPEHYAMANAASGNIEKFYEKELADRKNFRYPPFAGLARIAVRFPEDETEKYRKKMHKVAHDIEKELPGVEVFGPLAPAKSVKGDKRVLQLAIKGLTEKDKAKLPIHVPDDWTIDIDPEQIL